MLPARGSQIASDAERRRSTPKTADTTELVSKAIEALLAEPEPYANPDGLLAKCEWLHMVATGSADGPIEDSDRLALELCERVERWKDPNPGTPWYEYDELVKRLVATALDEYTKFRFSLEA